MIDNSTFNFGTVTINNITIDPAQRAGEKRNPDEKKPEDRYYAKNNDLNFAGIHAVLQKLGKMDVDNEKAAQKAAYERRRAVEIKKRILGDAYKYEVEEETSLTDNEMDEVAAKRPKPTELAEETPIAVSPDGRCRVYENGYALVKALSTGRDQMIWIPDCKKVRYRFGELTDAEKEYQSSYRVVVFEAEIDP